jgi:hypothetical protein
MFCEQSPVLETKLCCGTWSVFKSLGKDIVGLRPFCNFITIWYILSFGIFSRFGMLHQEKSHNPAQSTEKFLSKSTVIFSFVLGWQTKNS